MNASLLISYMTSVKNQRESGEYRIRSRPILSSSLQFSWSSCTVCSSKSSANVQQSLRLGASNLCANGERDLLFIYRLLNSSLDGKHWGLAQAVRTVCGNSSTRSISARNSVVLLHTLLQRTNRAIIRAVHAQKDFYRGKRKRNKRIRLMFSATFRKSPANRSW